MNTLSRFDPVTAAGILARAAAFVDDDSNPVAAGKISDEEQVRDVLIREFKIRLGVSETDTSDSARELVSHALDIESERLLEPTDVDATLDVLAQKGSLPTDLYRVVFETNLANKFGHRFETEKRIVQQTIHSAEQEQHFGSPGDQSDNTLISLFAKFYSSPKYPGKSFMYLVSGQRYGRTLLVAQAWRLYVDTIDLSNVTDLLSMLRRFTDRFGVKLQLGDQAGFFLQTELPIQDSRLEFKVKILGKTVRRDSDVMLCQFGARKAGSTTATVITMGIDIDKYLKSVSERGWDIF